MLKTKYLSPEQFAEHQSSYVDLIKFYYDKVKGLVLASEREDKDGQFSVVAVVEIRSAFDHVARAHTYMYEIPIEENNVSGGFDADDYCRKNLRKAHAHLYRAAYDAYDIIADRVIYDIDKFLEKISKDTLYAVIPDASDRIYSPYHEGKDLVSKAKFRKDVGAKNEEEQEFELYERATVKLLDARDLLQKKEKDLIAYEKDQKAKVFHDNCLRCIIPFAAMALGLFIGKVFLK